MYSLLRSWVFSVRTIFQKIFRGYSDDELWNLDITFAKFMYPRFRAWRALREPGIPGCLCKKFPIEEEAVKEFERRLDLIEQALEITLCEYGLDKNRHVNTQCKETVSDKIKCREVQDEGLRYLAEHWADLWD